MPARFVDRFRSTRDNMSDEIKCDASRKAAPRLKCTLPEDHEGDHQSGDNHWNESAALRP